HTLEEYHIQSKYKLTAISQAAGRLSQMKRDIRKGRNPKSPFVSKPYLASCYGFKINGMLLSIPTGNRNYAHILLNRHTISQLSENGIESRSFTITPNSLSISIRKDIQEIKCTSVIGIDRNLRNVTIGNNSGVVMYKTNKLLSIKENTSHVLSSFKRLDVRMKRHFQKRLGNRRSRRIQQHLHIISKDIVKKAVESKSMIVLEDLKGIRKLYKKGNWQGNKYRRKLNSWSFYELQRQIQYKASWEGIPVRFVDPKRTSKLCPICGDGIQEDRLHTRKLWCTNCKKSIDRDVVASLNISYKGWSRFCNPRGLSGEAMKGNVDWNNVSMQSLILRVDGSKLRSLV
ncbi:MAG: RNA-guided endonuclease InsQ/TnpB family protein, partial [Nitrosotalea sp.]